MTLVIADTGALISLGQVGCIELIEKVFGRFCIASAVWDELLSYTNPNFDKNILEELRGHVVHIQSKNHLTMVMDYGESESVILYEELQADYLLLDDRKARLIAESLDINCIGSLGLLIRAKNAGILEELRPIFINWISTERFFSKKLLNRILAEVGEELIS